MANHQKQNHKAEDIVAAMNEGMQEVHEQLAAKKIRTISINAENTNLVDIKLTRAAQTDERLAQDFETKMINNFRQHHGVEAIQNGISLDRKKVENMTIIDVALALDSVTEHAIEYSDIAGSIDISWAERSNDPKDATSSKAR